MNIFEGCYNDDKRAMCEKWLNLIYVVYYYASLICNNLVMKLQKMRFNQFLWTVVIFIFIMALINFRYIKTRNAELIYEHPKFDTQCLFDNVTDRIQTPYPAIIWWTYGSREHSESILCPNNKICHIYNYQDRFEPVEVGAYLFYSSGIKYEKLPLPRQPDKIIWAFSHEESPRNALELNHDEGLQLFNFSSTFSRHSDVPYPLQLMKSLESITSKDYFVETSKKNMLLKDISPIIYLQSDCGTTPQRDDYVKELMKFIPIDSYGFCVNNKQLPKNLTVDHLNRLYRDETLKFINRYKFMIAIENGVCDDYITEKFWRPIHVGVVPIYFGSPKIRDWFPNKKSAILLEDFPTPKILSDHIHTLLRNDSMYEEYLEHKTKGLIENKRLKYEVRVRPYQTNYGHITHTFECFVCEKLYDLKTKCEVNIVDKTHLNCPEPKSALTLKVNQSNEWVEYYERYKYRATKILEKIKNETTCRQVR